MGIGGGSTENSDEIYDLESNGSVIEGGESGDERGDEEVRVESKEGAEEGRLGESNGELRESIGDMESRGVRIGDQVGEAEEANGATFLSLEDQTGPVALGA